MENKTLKHNFIVKCDQFGKPVENNFYDKNEGFLIDVFEKYVLKLKDSNQSDYTMVELGSNQAYYSLLFKSILRTETVHNFMIEPNAGYMVRGQNHFNLNVYPGTFIPKSIGTHWIAHNINFNTETITVDSLIEEYNIKQIDVLHSDIDCSELIMLEGAKDSLKNKRIKYAFILTHGLDLHLKCLEFIADYSSEYEVIIDHREDNIGCDRLIMIESK